MTKPLPFTQAGLKRAIKAAQESGLHVLGIRPDGTLLLAKEPLAVAKLQPDDQATAPSKWEDVGA